MIQEKKQYAGFCLGISAMVVPLVRGTLAAFLLNLTAFPSSAATAPAVMDIFDIFSAQEGLGSLPADYFNSTDLLNELSEGNAVRNMIDQGVKDLAAGRKQPGMEKLKQAWAMDFSSPVAGIVLAHSYLQQKEFGLALEVAQKIQKYSPQIVEGYTLAGIADAGMNNFNKAQASFESALELRPHDADAGINLAQIYLEQKHDDKARTVLTDTVSNNPDNLVALYSLVNLEVKTGHLEKAISDLESAISKSPNDFRRRIALVRIYVGSNQMPKALATLAETLSQFPEQPDVVELAGVVHMQNGAFEKAVPLLESAVKFSPEKLTAHYNLALVYENLRQNMLALAEIDKALKLDPSHASSKFIRARLMAATGQLDAAQNILKELELSNSDSINIPELRGRIAIGQNKSEEAVNQFKLALKKQENNPQLAIQLGLALIAAKKPDAGYAVLRDWVGKHPNNISVRIILADILLDRNQYDEAEKYYSEVLELQPGRLDVSNNLAWLLAEKGKLDKAVDLAEKNYVNAPKNPLIIDTFATILLKNDQPKKAAELLREALTLSPENATIKYHLAQSLVGFNNEEAKDILKKLLASKQAFKERESSNGLLKKLESQ